MTALGAAAAVEEGNDDQAVDFNAVPAVHE